MSKKSNVSKWQGADKNLSRLIKNANAKISRLEKNHPELAEFLPPKFSKKEILKNVDNKKELKRVERSLERFTMRGSEKLVVLPSGQQATTWVVDELRNTAKAFNAKINYIAKKDPSRADTLPQTVKFRDLLESAVSHEDVARMTSSYQRFSKKGAENLVKSERGAKATKWEVDEFYRKQEFENEKRRKQREKLQNEDVKIGGESTGQTRARMGSIKENSLKDSNKKFDNMSQKEWEKASRNIDKHLDRRYVEERNELMRENYVKGLTEQGFLDDLPELEKMIRSLDFDTFIATVATDETATFVFYKDPLEYEVRKEKIYSAWKTAVENSQKID